MMQPMLKPRAAPEQIQSSFPRQREPRATDMRLVQGSTTLRAPDTRVRESEPGCSDTVGHSSSGRIRLIELNPVEALSGIDRAALGEADVVLFDRALAALVAAAVPSGSYAEPLSPGFEEIASAISPRAVKLAEEGWRVVQCVRARPGVAARLPGAAAALDGSAPLAGRDRPQTLIFTANGLAG